MRDHLLILGWNTKATSAIHNYLADTRYSGTDVVVVAPLDELPELDEPNVTLVRGEPNQLATLQRAHADTARAAIVLARIPSDPRSDHESALITTTLRRLNEAVSISVEMVDKDNREHLTYAGCNALIDDTYTIANLLVRAVQDVGVSDVVCELIASEVGSELYRTSVGQSWAGKTFLDYATAMVDKGICVVGLWRDGRHQVNPDPDVILRDDDQVFVVSREPPSRRSRFE